MHNLKERIEVQQLFSVEDCLANPNKLYIFGDNLLGVGKGGQAVIRDCPNTYGVPTKIMPNMKNHAFFSDNYEEVQETKDCLFTLHLYHRSGVFYSTCCFRTRLPILVFPSNGLGTGLSQMPTRSPKLYKLMNNLIYKYFGVYYE